MSDSTTSGDCIVVDLDGTLIPTDLLAESIAAFGARNPLHLFVVIGWLLQGRATLKCLLARKVRVEVEYLPYNQTLVAYLTERKRGGAHLVLATASHWRHARRVAAHLGIFDEVIATGARGNLKGVVKLAAIRSRVGARPFLYVGDSKADRPVWADSAGAILVNAPASELRWAAAEGKDEKVINDRGPLHRAFLRGMRLHQWAKNALIFVPLLTSHSYGNAGAVIAALIAFLLFGICASGVYLMNDLLDIAADRKHSTKKFRAIASGQLPFSVAIMGSLLLPLVAASLAYVLLPPEFIVILLIYYVLTHAYSIHLKHRSTADVLTLAMLYTLRILAGAVAISVTLSSWLMMFSLFMFLSLAYLKRYIEFADGTNDAPKRAGRGYTTTDAETMFALGTANATAAVVVLALFVNSAEVAVLYRSPALLWGLCLLLLFWVNRIWVGARRHKINEDPVLFAIKDRVSQMTGLLFVLDVLVAHFFVIRGIPIK